MVIVVFGLGLHQFNNCSLKDGQAFVQSKKHLAAMQAHRRFLLLLLSDACVRVFVRVLERARHRHLVAPARLCQRNSVGDIAAVCTTSSHFFSLFFGGLEMLSLHWRRLCIWAPSILLLFSSLLLLFFVCFCSSGCA